MCHCYCFVPNVLGYVCTIFIGSSNVLGTACASFIGVFQCFCGRVCCLCWFSSVSDCGMFLGLCGRARCRSFGAVRLRASRVWDCVGRRFGTVWESMISRFWDGVGEHDHGFGIVRREQIRSRTVRMHRCKQAPMDDLVPNRCTELRTYLNNKHWKRVGTWGVQYVCMYVCMCIYIYTHIFCICMYSFACVVATSKKVIGFTIQGLGKSSCEARSLTRSGGKNRTSKKAECSFSFCP